MSDPVSIAKSFLGVPYKFGGNDCNGIDCSGLVQKAYPTLPRTAHEQYQSTQHIRGDELGPGDLVFLQGTQSNLAPGQASHVGIYNGDGTVTEAPHSGASVRTRPLKQFIQGGLLGYGRVGGMGKTKGRSAPAGAMTQWPGPAGQAQQSGQSGPNGQGLDLVGLLHSLLGAEQRPQAPLYNPFAGQTVPNPGYNPTPAQQIGASGAPTDAANALLPADLQMPNLAPTEQRPPMRPYDDRETIQGPSLQSQANSQLQQAQQSAPNPMAAQVAEQKARSGLHKSIADLLTANPQADYQLPENLPFPDRQQAQIPQRPAPQFDPMSGGLAALAGILDPAAAGQYGQAPLQAGTDIAGQQYGDAIRNFQMKSDQLAQQYEHSLAARNDLAHYRHEQAGVGFENKNRARQAALLAGQNDAEAASAGGLADAFQGIGEQSKTAGAAGLQGDLLNQQIQQQLASNRAQTDYSLRDEQNQNKVLSSLLLYGGRTYAADQGTLRNQTTNDTRLKVGAGNNAATVERANIGAKARTDAAQTAAGASKYGADKRYQAALDRAAKSESSAGDLETNPTVPADLRSELSHWHQMVLQTHKKVMDLKADGRPVPPELADEQQQNATSYQSVIQRTAQWRAQNSRPARSGAPGGQSGPAAPARPALDPRIRGPILGPDGRPITLRP